MPSRPGARNPRGAHCDQLARFTVENPVSGEIQISTETAASPARCNPFPMCMTGRRAPFSGYKSAENGIYSNILQSRRKHTLTTKTAAHSASAREKIEYP